MTAQSDNDRLGNVAPGDLIELTLPGSAVRQFKVVHKESSGETVIMTLEGDHGETRDVELPADTVVVRTLESKWESPQSPTPSDGSV
ncbi:MULTISPECIES: hypothetical protein [Mycolicibacterium]|uniref:Oxidoreductase, FAD-linked n=3 Tax=Mycolicibacterium gilvum TaxID=1804 RepID=E6TNK2_MYCSR|nr:MULTISPECIES: hypothetical protein [Mycolicibacterium]ABP43519.1 conserved hypothetical protein [Mycolicibacterium gilvum PYR-GCK]ADU01679.1 hypothetical protein Mspyr1_51520 [Mycolicibacterium gilvum Spyr1]MBV5242224.1 hypothetical protein [Mycolicibacterium sp. PAM1]MCV7053996.1 hypothetical protein [Mycolicibacterium gilvum]STZ46258.1 oxidoreductase, FAD-linked [Mycolicibacterium gilvum]